MQEIMVVWGNDPSEVAALCDVRAAGRRYRVLRRDNFALVAVENTDGDALDSGAGAFCMVIQIE